MAMYRVFGVMAGFTARCRAWLLLMGTNDAGMMIVRDDAMSDDGQYGYP